MASILETACLPEVHQPRMERSRPNTVVRRSAIVALLAPVDQVPRVLDHPRDQGVPHGTSETQLALKSRANRAELTFQQLHTDFCTSIRLRVVFRWVFLQQLWNPLNPQLPEGLAQQLEDGWLVVALEDELRIAQPLDVLDNAVDREAVLVNALVRHHVPEHGLTLVVTHDEYFHGALARRLEPLLVHDVLIVAEEAVVERHNRGFAGPLNTS